MGLAAAATIVVAVLVAITLVPAFLGMIGLRALPKKARQDPAGTPERDTGFYRGWANLLVKQRVVSLVLGVAVLGVIAIPVFKMETSLIQAQPEGSTAAKADAIIGVRTSGM